MDEESLVQRVLHLRQVEKLSGRQIAKLLKVGGRRVSRILKSNDSTKPIPPKTVIDDYYHLMVHWFKEYPNLRAKQIFERLKEYGYQGSYGSVVKYSLEFRKTKSKAYHPLVFLPGEEAQVDWFFVNLPDIGKVDGFLYVLAYSRYAWGMFYPKHSFEFFLAGHVACFKNIDGLAHRHRYDNLKSVVIKHTPEEIKYNGQFLDFARHYNFSIHVCNPYSGNEKGRVERIIKDIRPFLYAEKFTDLKDLNCKFHAWLEKRNNTVHRSTGKTPKDLLSEERLKGLPHPYPTSRVIMGVASKTALVEFETNKYSVPSSCAGKMVEIAAYPAYIEIYVSEDCVANHNRCFDKNKMIQNPLHAEKLLDRSPHFKMQRILQLIKNMDYVFAYFIDNQENEDDEIEAAYQLFSLMKNHSRAMLISAVRELNTLKCFKIKALNSLLNLPEAQDPKPLWPRNIKLLNLKYEERNLNDYNPNKEDLGAT